MTKLTVTVSELQVTRIRIYLPVLYVCMYVCMYVCTLSESYFIFVPQTELVQLRPALKVLQITQQRIASAEGQVTELKSALFRSEETLITERSECTALQVRVVFLKYSISAFHVLTCIAS